MQVSAALPINHAALIQSGRKRIQVQELEYLLLVLVLHQREHPTFDIRRQVVLVTHDIRNKAVALNHLVAHVLEVYHVDALVQGSDGAGDAVLVFLVAVLLADDNITGIDAPEVVRDAVAQVVAGDTYRDGFNRIAAHHRDKPVQRLMEIAADKGTEIAHQHVRHQNHHVIHGDTYKVDALLAIEKAHHGHERIRNIDTDLGHAHEREHADKADKTPEHRHDAQGIIAVQELLAYREENQRHAYQGARQVGDVAIAKKAVQCDSRTSKSAEKKDPRHGFVHRTSILKNKIPIRVDFDTLF